MNKAVEIDHLCQVIKSNVYNCHYTNMVGTVGYVTQLKRVAAEGGYATEDTLEAMGLARAAEELRSLAQEITQVREHLIRNSIREVA